jgi:hypothetical protein
VEVETRGIVDEEMGWEVMKMMRCYQYLLSIADGFPREREWMMHGFISGP